MITVTSDWEKGTASAYMCTPVQLEKKKTTTKNPPNTHPPKKKKKKNQKVRGSILLSQKFSALGGDACGIDPKNRKPL